MYFYIIISFLDGVEILNSLKNVLDFKFHSAYDTNIKYSNYTQEFSGLLDYIYYTDKNLELIQVKEFTFYYYTQMVKLYLFFILRCYPCHHMMMLSNMLDFQVYYFLLII